MVSTRALRMPVLVLTVVARPDWGAAPAAPAPPAADPTSTPFTIFDSFSVCGPSPFPDSSAVQAFGIRPRGEFEILGWQDSLNASGPWTPLFQLLPVLRGDKLANQSWIDFCRNRSTTCPDGACPPDRGCVNGGVPQQANLTAQLQLLDRWLKLWVPDPAWSGYSSIDFEDWTPVWEENTDPSAWHGKRYQDYSVELVRAADPSLSVADATAQAKRAYETAALAWMVGVLQHIKKLRPNMKVGYYGIPNNYYCQTNWNPWSKISCYDLRSPQAPELRARNDALLPLWQASGALYPCIYLTGQFPPEVTAPTHKPFISPLILQSFLSSK